MISGDVEEALERDESLALLRGTGLARLVLSIDCLPAARPVLITLTGEDVVAAVPAGPEFDAAIRGDVVTIEIDGLDTDNSGLWSVSVTGIARAITDTFAGSHDQHGRTVAQVIEAGGGLIAIPTNVLQGRRVTLPTG